MIVPDLNLLVHAYNSDSPRHPPARAWWEGQMSAPGPIGLPWIVLLGFVRLSTHPSILDNPMRAALACGLVRSWLAQPQITILHPGDRHAELVLGFLEELGSAGNLTTDAHLAALTIEHQAELHTTDADFARFSGLKWRNPLAARR